MREVLEGIELGTTMFGVSEPDMVRRLGEYRDRPVGPGPGDKMLAAMTAWEWALTGGGADECVELARQALTDDSVVVAENGFLTVPAITVMAMADLDEAAERWDRLVAQTQASGSHFAVSCAHLWSGITQTRRGELAEAEALLRTGRDELSMWGPLPVDGAYFSGTIPLVLLERGDVEGARRELGERPSRIYDHHDAGHLWLRCETEILLAEGRNEEALERSEEFGEVVGRLVNPAWVPWRSLQAIALDRLGRTDEAVARAEEELEHARALGRAGHGRPQPAGAGHPAPRGGAGPAGRGGGPAGAARRPGWSWPRRWPPRAPTLRRERKPTDAREPLRRALELAEVCDAGGAGRRGAHRAVRHRQPAAVQRHDRARGADGQREARGRAGGGGADQPRHRPDPVRHAQDGRGPPERDLPQAGHPLAARARRVVRGGLSGAG